MAVEKVKTKSIAANREARHEYFVIEALECGISLVGTEVKSLREGKVNLKDSWLRGFPSCATPCMKAPVS